MILCDRPIMYIFASGKHFIPRNQKYQRTTHCLKGRYPTRDEAQYHEPATVLDYGLPMLQVDT